MNPAAKIHTVGLCLQPLDVLFFRDGRPFCATTRVPNGPPLPQGQQRAGWQPREAGMRALWLKQLEPPTEAAAGYLTGKGLQIFLEGKVPDREAEVVRTDELFAFDHRTGIEIAADQLSAKE